MKKSIILAAALVLVSCGQKQSDPVQDAIELYIFENMPEMYTQVTFNTLEKVDSTTFREEFEHRKKAFEARLESDEKFILKYTLEKKQKNVALKTLSYKKTLRIIQALDSLEKASAGIMDDVAYYDYKFSATAKGQNARMDFEDTYATVTPDLRVMSMTTDIRDLHKSLGRAIPGYLDIVKGDEEELTVLEELD